MLCRPPGYYCLNAEVDSYRACLNPHIGVSAFSRNCLKVLLPRGTINVTFPDLRNVGESAPLRSSSCPAALMALAG